MTESESFLTSTSSFGDLVGSPTIVSKHRSQQLVDPRLGQVLRRSATFYAVLHFRSVASRYSRERCCPSVLSSQAVCVSCHGLTMPSTARAAPRSKTMRPRRTTPGASPLLVFVHPARSLVAEEDELFRLLLSEETLDQPFAPERCARRASKVLSRCRSAWPYLDSTHFARESQIR